MSGSLDGEKLMRRFDSAAVNFNFSSFGHSVCSPWSPFTRNASKYLRNLNYSSIAAGSTAVVRAGAQFIHLLIKMRLRSRNYSNYADYENGSEKIS
jgi:hypothetical protein